MKIFKLYKLVNILSVFLLLFSTVASFYCCSLPYGEWTFVYTR